MASGPAAAAAAASATASAKRQAELEQSLEQAATELGTTHAKLRDAEAEGAAETRLGPHPMEGLRAYLDGWYASVGADAEFDALVSIFQAGVVEALDGEKTPSGRRAGGRGAGGRGAGGRGGAGRGGAGGAKGRRGAKRPPRAQAARSSRLVYLRQLIEQFTAGGPSDCSPTWCSRAQTISNATELRPVGMMTSAHTFDGSTNCTCIGRTVSRYL